MSMSIGAIQLPSKLHLKYLPMLNNSSMKLNDSSLLKDDASDSNSNSLFFLSFAVSIFT